jgi:DNA repair protein RadD
MQLFEYQERGVNEILGHWSSGKKRVLYALPPGGGKTETARVAIQRQGGRWGWVTHRTELARQSSERVGAQVLTVQSMLAGARFAGDIDGIVFDECHHLPSSEWFKTLEPYTGALLLGLSGTPARADGRALGDHFDAMATGPSYSELRQLGRLVGCRIFSCDSNLATGVAADPVESWLQHAPHRPKTFCFVSTTSMAHDVVRRFNAAGVPAAAILAATPQSDRDDAMAQFRSGELVVLVSIDCLGEGVDVPEAECAILARRFEFVASYLQATARVLRAHPGKQRALIIDLVGAWLRHGPPTIDREFSLDGKPIRQGVALKLKNCVQCGFVLLQTVQRCSECGYVFTGTAREVQIFSEDLREVYDGSDTPAEARRAEWQRLNRLCIERGWALKWAVEQYARLFDTAPPATWLATRENKSAEYQRLMRVVKTKGFQPGFAAHKYRDLFGVWPRGMSA